MKKKQKRPLWKRLLAGVGIVLGAAVIVVVFVAGWLSIGEYKPEEREPVEVEGKATEMLYPYSSVRLVTWNIGYGALGDETDFFMDGGSGVRTADEERVTENIEAVIAELSYLSPDVIFLQEVDEDSERSWGINERAMISEALPEYQAAFAYNYRVMFVPYPLPPIGGVNAGLLTLCVYPASEAERVQLPCPFSWPVRIANLKRCLLVERIPVYGSEKELVLVNLHLEAYDDGEGKLAQTEMLRELLQEEADAGNYVVAGGDFNQLFSSIENPYPYREGVWTPGELDVSVFPEEWQFVMDEEMPSCRSLDRPLADADPEDFQYYLIDGFIVSADLSVNRIETQDLGFVNSDHNPVVLDIRLPISDE